MIISNTKIKIGKNLDIFFIIRLLFSFYLLLGKRENMESKLGVTLRKVRKGKQISLCSVADKHLSKSQISHFERGESDFPEV